MAILDIILLILFVPAIISGFRKGFTKQLIDFVAIIASVLAACNYYAALSTKIAEYITMDAKLLNIISFIAIMTVIMLILGLLGAAITKTLEIISLGWLNRLLGILISLFKTVLIIGLLIIIFESVNSALGLVDQASIAESAIYTIIKDLSLKIFPFLKEFVASTIDSVGTVFNG